MAMESSLMSFDFSKWMLQKREPQLALQLPCPIKHTLIIVLKGYEGFERFEKFKGLLTSLRASKALSERLRRV